MSLPLPDRVRRGETAAFFDPALTLHLCVEPGADWWWLGCQAWLLGWLYLARPLVALPDGPDPAAVRRLLTVAAEREAMRTVDPDARAVLAIIRSVCAP